MLRSFIFFFGLALTLESLFPRAFRAQLRLGDERRKEERRGETMEERKQVCEGKTFSVFFFKREQDERKKTGGKIVRKATEEMIHFFWVHGRTTRRGGKNRVTVVISSCRSMATSKVDSLIKFPEA